MKSAKWWMKVLMATAVCLCAQGAESAEIRNVTAEYAWPWGAEIRYEVVGAIDASALLVVAARDRVNNATYTAEPSALSGDTGSNTGTHRLMWDLDKQGINIQSTNVVFTVMYDPLYCVVDLSGGANASSYPVTYMDTPPSGGFNTRDYKTTKLVLRRIEPGTFNMHGSYQVTLTKPFYVGIFEVTQEQWSLVMGSNPSCFSGAQWPVECVSYNMIRGSSSGAKWPASNAVDASSFMGRLRARTGLAFDLPTEAQWEYACRAGTTTAYSYGDSANRDYMMCDGRRTLEVGSKKANPWGLYDMHGNVWEWCLDWYGSLSGGTDPKGASSGSDRVRRGGSWWDDASGCTSSIRGSYTPSFATYTIGFRLVRTLSN